MSDPREFHLRSPERAIAVVRGHLRDAAVAISRSLRVADAVVSAFLKEEQSRPVLTGYLHGSGEIKIHRYLNASNGIEFENWSDSYRQPMRSLPDNAWTIMRFGFLQPPSGVVGEALLTLTPHELSLIDFAQESGGRRKHYGRYIVDAMPVPSEFAGKCTARFVIRDADGRELGPIGIHAHYETADRAIESAISQAETMIDVGLSLPELSQLREETSSQ